MMQSVLFFTECSIVHELIAALHSCTTNTLSLLLSDKTHGTRETHAWRLTGSIKVIQTPSTHTQTHTHTHRHTHTHTRTHTDKRAYKHTHTHIHTQMKKKCCLLGKERHTEVTLELTSI